MPSSEGKCGLNYSQESVWEPQFLKEKCTELGIESEFIAYQRRLLRSYVSVFFVFHTGVTLIHCILITTLSHHSKYVYFDVGIYVGSCLVLILILSINFWEKLISRHTWIMFASSALACFILAGVDLGHSLHHHFVHDWQCGTLYNAYIIFMIYTFLPILSIHLAVILAVVVSCAYIIYFMTIIYSHDNSMMSLTCDIALYMCLNVVCILFRIVNDMIVRSSFIDRHQFIKEELSLRNAQRQEKLLLDSIMPSQLSGLLQQDIKKTIMLSQQLDPTPMQILIGFRRSLAIQAHSDVSILYADVVNYTHLTTTLTVEKLVTTLHDLYARFDLAAQHYRVQRIKFLGDCYYCVAGLANADPDHANNAVALGIAMIAHIQKVRDAQQLDIDMRIGVHSGSVYAGVIGEAKLQYDVWGEQGNPCTSGLLTTTFRVPLGPDVTIANVLESTGVPGAVHISDAVLRNLNASCEFTIESGPEKAKNDPVLQKHNITTYIIVFSSNEVLESAADSRNLVSFFNLSRASSYVAKTVVNEELREEYRKMPVMGFDPTSCWHKGQSKSQLSTQVNICLIFNDSDMEKPYLKQRDILSKYFMLLAWTVGLAEICIKIKDNDHLYIWTGLIDCFVALFLTVMLFIAWYKNICWIRYGKKNIPHSYNRVSCTIFRIHEKVQESLTVRVCTFLFIMVLLWVLIGISMVSCHYAEFILQYIEERIFHYESDTTTCFYSWDATSIFALMTCLALSFSHIPSLLKTSVALAQVIIFCILIFFQFDFVFHHSTTTNPFLPSEFAHAMVVVVTFVTMFLKERQTEFCKRVNFSWRVELERKQNAAEITNRSISTLLNNILPSHVVDIYLNSLAKHELYYENYKMVSVMFAMLTNFQMDLSNLRILNDVITQFDELLVHYREDYVVEKIKIANYTYIAACGLDVNIASCFTSKPLTAGSLNEEKRVQLMSYEDQDEVVFVMASFALDLMRTLASCNNAYNGIVKEHALIDGMITIGISSGEIMAGIVGASKPHYDIWGDPVNMAARMEMTGLSGHIQVTEESAKILQAFGIQCNYRGQTFVKGRGLLPTYFLGIDQDYNFIQEEGTRKLRSSL